MELRRISYDELTSRQKEIYNFQKVAGILADFGFNCIKLNDDWQGADFLAYHKDGQQTLKIQLKSRLSIYRKYISKEIYMCFPIEGRWYLVPHDELLELVRQHTPWLDTKSWGRGGYSSAKPSHRLRESLSDFALQNDKE